MPFDPNGLCPSHGLRAAPDGLCVLCRRSAPPPPRSSAAVWLGLALGVAVLGIGAGLALRGPAQRRVPLHADGVGVASEERLPAEAGSEPDMRGLLSQVSVTLYTTSWCGYCRKTRALLQQNGIAYQELDIEQDEAAQQRARQLNPRGGVPVLQIDDQVVLGYSPQGISAGLSTALSRRSGRPIQIELTN